MVGKWKSSGCSHDAATLVFKVGKAHIWAGSQDELLERFGWRLVVSAIGYTRFSKAPLTATKSAHELLPEALFDWTPPPCIGIEWPDGGIPAVSLEWWGELATAIRGLKGNIGLCCMGGHGRTGTMLAILAAKLGKVKKGDCPVEWVRNCYCKKVVETTAQLDYIERVTGMKVPSEASNIGLGVTAALPYSYAGGAATPSSAAGAAKVVVNPTLPSSKGQASATASGYGAGVIGSDLSDEELLEAWFKAEGDTITVTSDDGPPQYLRPVWDKDGELAGWEDTAQFPEEGGA